MAQRFAIVVEVPKGSFVKRKPNGEVDFVSPLPAPFNYGSVPDTVSPDGDPLDALLLGPRRPAGYRAEATELARVDFVDAGDPDPKIVLGEGPLRRRDRLRVELFFRTYAHLKRVLNGVRGKSGATEYRGIALVEE